TRIPATARRTGRRRGKNGSATVWMAFTWERLTQPEGARGKGMLDTTNFDGRHAGGMSCRKGTAPPPYLRLGMGLLGAILVGGLPSGCGSGKTAPGTRLEGAVTLDGNPIAEGNLQFVPQDPGGGSPVVAAIKGGRYVAPTVPRGKIRVLVTATKKTGKMITTYSQPYEEIVNIIPDKYQQGIEITVTEDNPNLDFELRSR